ncbi:MAG TPA: Clp protease N-terminal domain-containing protein, partial [Gemmatimonadaceae bacterium]|nr:Clp protease N-terminal domain-containing protein [Gemmatimonadaceae bacterium]
MLIAGLNGRAAVVEMLMRRGVPVDYLGWGGMSLLHLAVGNQRAPFVEALVRVGADLDLEGYRPHATPRELARQRFEAEPESRTARRILELCGLDPEQVLAAAAARRPSPPPLDQRAMRALELAGDDAARQGRADIRPDNLLIGILRTPFPLPYLSAGGVDLDRLRSAIGGRVLPADDRVHRPRLPLAADVRAAVERAVAVAAERRRDAVSGSHLLHGLIDNEASDVARLLVSAGASLSRLRRELARF